MKWVLIYLCVFSIYGQQSYIFKKKRQQQLTQRILGHCVRYPLRGAQFKKNSRANTKCTTLWNVLWLPVNEGSPTSIIRLSSSLMYSLKNWKSQKNNTSFTCAPLRWSAHTARFVKLPVCLCWDWWQGLAASACSCHSDKVWHPRGGPAGWGSRNRR